MRAKTEAARLNQAIRRPVANALAPSVQHLLQTLCGPPLRSCGPLPRAVTPCYFGPPVARRLSSAVRALSPARTRRFDSCQLTESLKRLLVSAVQRISGQGGDPVVQLQTNFGGGKTHSMLALYHLFSGTTPSELVGIDAVLQQADAKKLPTAKRVVLVGNKISPSNPVKKPDGTIVRTLWGELAWQLGGKKAFQRVRVDDEKA